MPFTLKSAALGPFTEQYLEQVNAGTPRFVLLFLHGMSGTKADVQLFPEFNAIQGAVIVSPDTGGAYNNGLGTYEQNARLLGLLQKVKADYGVAHAGIVGYSGGMTTGLNLMAFEPAAVDFAVLWNGITDLVAWWHEGALEGGDRGVLEGCLYGPPDTPQRLEQYRLKSPMAVMDRIRVKRVTINRCLQDVKVPPYQHFDAYRVLRGLPGVSAFLVDHQKGHVFGSEEAAISVAQIQAHVAALLPPLTGTQLVKIPPAQYRITTNLTQFGGAAALSDGQTVEATVNSAVSPVADAFWVITMLDGIPRPIEQVRFYSSDGGFTGSNASAVSIPGRSFTSPADEPTTQDQVRNSSRPVAVTKLQSEINNSSCDLVYPDASPKLGVFGEIIPNVSGEGVLVAEIEVYERVPLT